MYEMPFEASGVLVREMEVTPVSSFIYISSRLAKDTANLGFHLAAAINDNIPGRGSGSRPWNQCSGYRYNQQECNGDAFSIARRYLDEMAKLSPDALVLGCTHYPILRDVIQQTVGENVTLIDSGVATAEEVGKLLIDKDLANPEAIRGPRSLCDDLDHFYVTDAAERFAKVAERFLGTPPAKLEAIEVYGADELKKK
jgi:hypothetical protein